MPRLYGAIEDRLDALGGKRRAKPIPSFLRVGSWIGGDRDGNPFVTAEVLNEAMRLQSARALAYYLDELHELGAELSLAVQSLPPSARNSTRSPTAPAILAAARREEPYRRAITGMYSRLAKTARELDHVIALRQPVVDLPAYASRRRIRRPISTTIAQSLKATGGAIVTRGRLRLASARGRRVRLPSRADRSQAELQGARAHRRRDFRRRLCPASTIAA